MIAIVASEAHPIISYPQGFPFLITLGSCCVRIERWG